jgi:alpha-1,3-rhamnosyl/mannosyltransferase
MRVGFDARWYSGAGIGTYILQLVKALAQYCEDIELVLFEPPNNRLPFENDRLIRVPTKGRLYYMHTPAGQLALRKMSQDLGLDVFHCPFYAAPLFLTCPLIITIHDLIPFMFPTGKAWTRPLVNLGYKAAARRASHIIADSQTTARDTIRLLGVAPEKVHAIYIAADNDVYKTMIEENELSYLQEKYKLKPPYVVVPSARNWRTKNLKSALEALYKAQKSYGLTFQVAVYGPDDGLRALTPTNCWKDMKIDYLGFVPDSDLAALFRNAELFVSIPLYEGFGLPMLEAMSTGCAVVTSNAGSVTEVVADAAQCFPPTDIEAISTAIGEFFRSSEVRDTWRARALARPADFSWRRAAEQTADVYRLAARKK